MILRCLLSTLLVTTLPATADDWPEILGPKRRGISQETGWNMDWNTKEPPVAWKAKVGTGASGCAVAGGKVVTMGASQDGTETVYCVDLTSGKELWSQTYDCEFDKRMWDGGTSTTPVIDGDRVYTLSFRGQLFCWNLADGKKLWELHMEREFKGAMPYWGWSGSPLVVGNMLIIEPGGNGSSRAAVDKLTGKVFWQSGTDPVAYASPVIFSNPAMRGVALVNANGLVAINPRDGSELFRHEWKTPHDVNAAIPVHRDGKFLLSSGYDTGLAQVAPGTGEVWTTRKIMMQFQSPVLYQDHLYLISGDNKQSGTLQCLDWATGTVKWKQSVGGNRGNVIIAADKLIAVTEGGEVILAAASPAGFQELGRVQALSARVWAAPAFSNQRILVRNNAGSVVCLDLTP